MAKYIARLLSSFIMYTAAFIIIVIMTLIGGWYSDGKNTYHFTESASSSSRSTSSSSSYQNIYSYYYGYLSSSITSSSTSSSSGDNSGLSDAIFGLLFTSVALAAICALLTFIMMCFDCCCHIKKKMMVIPRITTGISQLAGLFAEAGCAVFLVKLYVKGDFKSLSTNVVGSLLSYTPSYCFFLVIVAGIILQVAGCIECGVRPQVESVIIVESGGMQQQQQQQQQMQQGMFTMGMPLYQQQAQTGYGNQPYYPAVGMNPVMGPY